MLLASVEPKDIKALVRLVKAATPLYAWISPKDLHAHVFNDPGSDPQLALQALDKKTLLGCALAVLRQAPQGKVAYLKYFAVAPKARRKGVASLLFGELERRLMNRGARELHLGGGPAPYLANGVEVSDTGTHCFLLRRKFQRRESIIDMTCDLRKLKVRWSPAELKELKAHGVRKAGKKDIEPLLALIRRDFPAWEWEALNGLQQGEVWVAGPAGAVHAFACADATNPGYFGPTGTAVSQRGKGLGRLLLFKSMEALRKRGHKTARIPWVAPLQFYNRHTQAQVGPVFWHFSKSF